MESNPLVYSAVALVLVLLNGWFVAAEFALVKVRRARLLELVEAGDKKAKRLLGVTEKLDEYLSAIQLGVTLSSIGLGWLGHAAILPLFVQVFGPSVAVAVSATLAFALISLLHVVLGEIVPKSVAIQQAEKVALFVCDPLRMFRWITFLFVKTTRGLSATVVRMAGLRPASEAETAHTEEELRLIVEASHAHGKLEQSTRDLIDNVFEYTQRVAREVMRPRRDVVVLEVERPVDQSIALAIEQGYTRYPLVDHGDRVLGFVHVKDLVALATGTRKVKSLTEVARQPVFVPEQVPIDRVRRQLQARRTHFGIVVDEFGDFTGILTLEDLLEELVGDIQDELDVEPPKIIRRSDGTAEVEAGILLDAARKKLSLRLSGDVEGIDTLGGYVFNLLGRAPITGDEVVVGEHKLEVVLVDDMRIRRLKVTPLPDASASAS